MLFLTALFTSLAACSPAPAEALTGFPPSVEAGAAQLAEQQHPRDAAERARYQRSLLGLHADVQARDFAIIYNTGGFGGAPMAGDAEWLSVMRGIETSLLEKGLSTVIIEFMRAHYRGTGFMQEVVEMSRGYPNKAPQLARELEFLLHYNPSLKMIVTGRSHGAVFANQVMKLLEGHPRVFAILAGTPFWYRGSFGENTLFIDSNGTRPDAYHRGDWGTIIKANLHLPRRQPPPGGAIQILKWYINMPGHEYHWQYPAVRARIRQFLDTITEKL